MGDFIKGYLSATRRPTKLYSSEVGYFFTAYIAREIAVMKSLVVLTVIDWSLMLASTSGEKLLGSLNDLQMSSHVLTVDEPASGDTCNTSGDRDAGDDKHSVLGGLVEVAHSEDQSGEGLDEGSLSSTSEGSGSRMFSSTEKDYRDKTDNAQ